MQGNRRTISSAALAVLVGFILAPVAAPVAASASGSAERTAAPTGTVWLCQPGTPGDPCTYDLAATSVAADGSTKAVAAAPDPSSRFDCFYVYPTVSTEQGDNADLLVQRAEIDVAVSQASRFSQVCRVWAPMYRQVTVASLLSGRLTHPAVIRVAYDSLLSAWKDYLAHDNDGRPVVFIGHSQGAAMLIRLLHKEIDPDRALRHRMVSAIILGGNVQVPVGHDVGGSFAHIPTCGTAHQTGCVIAYSTFGTAPPKSSFFGRPGQGVSLLSGQTASAGLQVACVNPATFSRRAASLSPYFLSANSQVPGVTVTTPWVTFPKLYNAQCKSARGATWLQVTPTSAGGDRRPTVSAVLGPQWGYHLDDVNLALGNLVTAVARQEAAYH